MDVQLSAADREFRVAVRRFIAANLDQQWRTRCRAEDEAVAYQREWDRRLYAGGYAGIWWPRAAGGYGASAAEKVIFEEEMARAGAPEGLAKVGKRLAGPGLIRFGTPEQQARYLGPILTGETTWCQGYSEPMAGSDLASVRCRAEPAEGGYLVTGSKIWTTYGHESDKCFALVRSRAGSVGRDGLSILLIDMRQPGIEIRRILRQGGDAEYDEVFYTDVFVSDADVLGGEGNGWQVATYILGYERGAAQILGRLARIDGHLREYARIAADSPEEMQTVARYAMGFAGVRVLAYTVLSEQLAGGEPGSLGSIGKLAWSEMWRSMAEDALEFAGESAMSEVDHASAGVEIPLLYLDSWSATIASGTSEIQRNIIAKRILGLPSSRGG